MEHTVPQHYIEALTAFRRYLDDDGKARRTIQSYTSDVYRFLTYAAERGHTALTDLSRSDITPFLREIRTVGCLKPATINKAVNFLSCFCGFLKETGILPEDTWLVDPRKDTVKTSVGSEREVDALTDEQVDRLLSFVDRSELVTQRDRLIVYLLLYTGCRVSELVNIKLESIDPVVGTLAVEGKGGKLREVPLRPDLLEMVRRYIGEERGRSRFGSSDYLLLSQRGPKMDRDSVNTMLERLVQLGKLPFRLRPHLFRHTFCSRLIARNVPLTTAQKLAGHSSVLTTAHYYVATTRSEKLDAVELL